jgi:Gene product 88
MYHPQTILSRNGKTGVSLDLPIKAHCRPTKNCAKDCYARCGRMNYPDALKKHSWTSRYLEGSDIKELIREARMYFAVRLNGSGDLNSNHTRSILNLAKACPMTQFWGMTRKAEIAKALNGRRPNLRLLVSVDASSPKAAWNYQGAMCWGPRRAEDVIPQDPRIKVVFPRHFAGHVIKGIKPHPLDCQAVWHNIEGCHACGRCWSWKGNSK